MWNPQVSQQFVPVCYQDWLDKAIGIRHKVFFQTLPQKGITLTPGIYSAFLSCFAKKSLWQAALHLLKSAESGNSGELFAKELDTPVYNTVITSCSRASKWPWSIVLLEQLISHQNSFRKANLYSFNATLRACERRGLWTHGCALLQQMQENQVTPDSASLNCLLSACEKGQEWQKALTFLSHFSSDRPMTLVTYGAIVANCVVGSAWEGALNSLLEAMNSNLRPSTELFNSLTECCRKSWAWRHCLWLMEMNLSQSKIQWLATKHAIEQAQQVQMKIETAPWDPLFRCSNRSNSLEAHRNLSREVWMDWEASYSCWFHWLASKSQRFGRNLCEAFFGIPQWFCRTNGKCAGKIRRLNVKLLMHSLHCPKAGYLFSPRDSEDAQREAISLWY